MESFEDFLKEVHAEEYLGTDDNMPDAFDNWLGELDGEDYIKWGDLYGQKMHIAGSRETIANIRKSI